MPRIQLPEDKALVMQLTLKLAEYEGRLEAHGGQGGRRGIIDSWCKIVVLRRLLEKGEVDFQDFYLKLFEEGALVYSVEFWDCFLNAFTVIRDYCEAGGCHIQGGTGLPRLPPEVPSA